MPPSRNLFVICSYNRPICISPVMCSYATGGGGVVSRISKSCRLAVPRLAPLCSSSLDFQVVESVSAPAHGYSFFSITWTHPVRIGVPPPVLHFQASSLQSIASITFQLVGFVAITEGAHPLFSITWPRTIRIGVAIRNTSVAPDAHCSFGPRHSPSLLPFSFCPHLPVTNHSSLATLHSPLPPPLGFSIVGPSPLVVRGSGKHARTIESGSPA